MSRRMIKTGREDDENIYVAVVTVMEIVEITTAIANFRFSIPTVILVDVRIYVRRSTKLFHSSFPAVSRAPVICPPLNSYNY